MKIYIDSEYCCHTINPDGVFQEIETDFFDGKCDDFIEGYLTREIEDFNTNPCELYHITRENIVEITK